MDNLARKKIALDNLIKLVKHHRDNCKNENCEILLYWLKDVAEYLKGQALTKEEINLFL